MWLIGCEMILHDVAYLRQASSLKFFVIYEVSLDSIALMSQLTVKEQDEVLKLAARSKKPAFFHTKIGRCFADVALT